MEKKVYSKGFSLIELLVVMVIIALLAAMMLPAVRRTRSRAIEDRARAEMMALSSTLSIVRMDTGYYVRLCDLARTKQDIGNVQVIVVDYDDPDDPDTWTWTWEDNTHPAVELDSNRWDGPYQIFQERAVFDDTNNVGSRPNVTGVAGWDSVVDFPDGTPLDPWGNAYGIGYNPAQRMVIIYSAGPDGAMQTPRDDVSATDDDIIYRFR